MMDHNPIVNLGVLITFAPPFHENFSHMIALSQRENKQVCSAAQWNEHCIHELNYSQALEMNIFFNVPLNFIIAKKWHMNIKRAIGSTCEQIASLEVFNRDTHLLVF